MRKLWHNNENLGSYEKKVNRVLCGIVGWFYVFWRVCSYLPICNSFICITILVMYICPRYFSCILRTCIFYYIPSLVILYFFFVFVVHSLFYYSYLFIQYPGLFIVFSDIYLPWCIELYFFVFYYVSVLILGYYFP